VQQRALFIIDGTVVATHTVSTRATSTCIGYDVGITTSLAAAVTMDVDFLRVWSDDPAGGSASASDLELLNSLVTEEA